jgi:drug/metabolite transporter (DMT)-like permease
MAIAVAYAVCALVWGTTWFAIRVCIGDGGYPTLPAAALRFTVALAVLAPIWLLGWARPGPRGRAQWLWLVCAGLLNAAGYTLVYYGEEHVSGGVGATLYVTEPLMMALLVTVTGIEKVRPADLLGALVALAGVAIIYVDRDQVSAAQASGVALILAAVLISAVYSIIIKRTAAAVNPMAITTVFLAVTTAAMWLLVLVHGWQPVPWPPPLEPTLALVHLALFGSVVAFATFFWLLQRIKLMTSVTLVFVIPVVALAVDALWEKRVTMTGRTWLGVAVTFAGVAVSVALRPRQAPVSSSASGGGSSLSQRGSSAR